MSDVAQTTRNTIQGIYTDDQAQIIFMDTPGIHKPQDRLGTFMNSTALNSIFGVDLVLFLAPANEKIGRGDKYIIERLKEADGPVFLILSKIDTVSKEELVVKLQQWQELFDFKEIIPISAKENNNVDLLLKTVSYTHLVLVKELWLELVQSLLKMFLLEQLLLGIQQELLKNKKMKKLKVKHS